ncbi:hypothetical protein DWB77_05523 [Streptomyces hundungensis]|uniref:Uncharacterized protein n=1 Tax=Streptomyces hundungensis TaxID=1077946 RepID=A0A387HR46_9ACTN|nr:hypothetical protein DWB77_05523 [Streptomyces hundungensis]
MSVAAKNAWPSEVAPNFRSPSHSIIPRTSSHVVRMRVFSTLVQSRLYASISSEFTSSTVIGLRTSSPSASVNSRVRPASREARRERVSSASRSEPSAVRRRAPLPVSTSPIWRSAYEYCRQVLGDSMFASDGRASRSATPPLSIIRISPRVSGNISSFRQRRFGTEDACFIHLLRWAARSAASERMAGPLPAALPTCLDPLIFLARSFRLPNARRAYFVTTIEFLMQASRRHLGSGVSLLPWSCPPPTPVCNARDGSEQQKRPGVPATSSRQTGLSAPRSALSPRGCVKGPLWARPCTTMVGIS